MSVHATEDQALAELIDRNLALYDGPKIEEKLKGMIKNAPQSKLSDWDIHRILRTSRAVLCDTHVEVVSGHHTASFLRFESIAKIPQLITLIARDMADWIHNRFSLKPITGVLATSSDAQLLASQIAEHVFDGQLGLAIGIDRLQREVLADRQGLGRAVYRTG